MIEKQNIAINFGQGLDTKTDPYQVQIGKFLSLENTIFNVGGLLTKRNGYSQLASLPDNTSKYVTPFNGNLVAVDNELNAYSSGSGQWLNKGQCQPILVDTLPTVRNAANQSQADSVVAANGLICTAYTQSDGSNTFYYYVIADSVTGQNVVAPTLIPTISGTVNGSPKVFLLGNLFIILYDVHIGSSHHIEFFAINTGNPSQTTGPGDLTTTYSPSATQAFDAVVSNNTLYCAYNASDIGGAIRVVQLNSALAISSEVVFSGFSCTLMSVTSDISGSTPVIYATFYNSSNSTGYTLAVNQNLGTILAPVQVISSGTVLNITSSVLSGVLNFFYEISNNYSYDSAIPSHLIMKNTITEAGVVGSASTFIRSVGLASKSFVMDSVIYMLVAYQSSFQPSCFLVNDNGNIISKLAYSNGGGYLTKGLPPVNVQGETASIAYLFKDFVSSVNSATDTPTVDKNNGAVNNTAGIYSQTGVNLVTFTFNTANIVSGDIGGNLNVSGGIVWAYDGFQPVEQGFNVWPDNVEIAGSTSTGHLISQQYYYAAIYSWTDQQGNIFNSAPSIPVGYNLLSPTSITGDEASGSFALVNVSSVTSLQPGQAISGGAFPSGTFIVSVDSATQITLNNKPAATNTGVMFNVTAVSATTVNIPTLRLTYKPNVKIQIFRWSMAQQNFFQITSVTAPTLNDPTVDSISFTDTFVDSAIIGNELLYVTGGVLENIGPPPTNIMTLYKSRLFLVDAEDKNLIWFSKQVIENTPVEMSDLLTIYVAPTISAQGSTGPITALSSMDDKLIIFKKDAIYYLTGQGPDNTGANNDFSDPIFITSTVGCANEQSIVFMPNGIMFQSDKGIYLLGRDLNTTYIGAPVQQFNTGSVNSANSIPATNQVRFTLSGASVSTLVYDYYYQQWSTFTGVSAISSTLFNGLHTYINASGQVFQESPGTYIDSSNPVTIQFTTGWINPAGLQGYIRSFFFYLLGTYYSPHKLLISIAYDYNSSPVQSVLIQPNNFAASYGGSSPYGQEQFYGGPTNIEQWRVFLSKQRCMAFQLTVEEVYDPSFGVAAGQGLTISGLNLVVGVKKGWRPIANSNSIGGNGSAGGS